MQSDVQETISHIGEAVASKVKSGEWEVPVDWTYIGHGEWVPPEEQKLESTHTEIERQPPWVYKWQCQEDRDIKLHQEVIEGATQTSWGPGGPSRQSGT